MDRLATVLERIVEVLDRLERRLPVEPAASMHGGLLTVEEVARRLGKSPRDVYRLVRRGGLKKVPNLGARTTRFRPADVERLLADLEGQPGRRRL